MTVKEQLTSIDVHILAKELDRELNSARVEKVYQISERTLKIRVHITGKGSRDLIIAPNFSCITGYPYKAPEIPSSFAMQLRKHLGGAFIREISQHNFDRILEFKIESKGVNLVLIAELFSTGNVILCDSGGNIIGLLEWQKWKDRKLGVGQMYEYPPEAGNPMLLDYAGFREILKSEKKLVVSLASDIGITKLYAEELCLLSGLDKEIKSNSLKENEIEVLFRNFKKLMELVESGTAESAVILDEDNTFVDVVPFDLEIYKNSKKKKFSSFNDAVDDYFSRAEFDKSKEDTEKNFRAKLEKLQKIEVQQKGTIRQFEEKAEEFKKIGDLIYQNISDIEEITGFIRAERESGKSWDEIKKDILSLRVAGIKIKGLDENKGLLMLED